MKQAILITAYRDFDQLLDLVALFDDRFGVYIHIDKKSNCGDRIYDSLKGQSHVQWVSSDYTINWGGRNHLLAILSLCKKAFADGKYSYFHLITGQDLPIKPFVAPSVRTVPLPLASALQKLRVIPAAGSRMSAINVGLTTKAQPPSI